MSDLYALSLFRDIEQSVRPFHQKKCHHHPLLDEQRAFWSSNRVIAILPSTGNVSRHSCHCLERRQLRAGAKGKQFVLLHLETALLLCILSDSAKSNLPFISTPESLQQISPAERVSREIKEALLFQFPSSKLACHILKLVFGIT